MFITTPPPPFLHVNATHTWADYAMANLYHHEDRPPTYGDDFHDIG